MDKAEIYARANILMHEARYQNLGCECDLKWELGIGIVAEIMKDLIMEASSTNVKATMMGYPVDINYEDENVIKLWREVRA